MAVMDGAAFAELVQAIGDNDRQAGLLAASVNEAYEAGRREILREIAGQDPGVNIQGVDACFFCGAAWAVLHKDSAQTITGVDHTPSCLWLRAQAVKD